MEYNVVPAAPFLHKARSVATPDGGLLYIAPRCVVYIGPYPDNNENPVIVQIYARQVVKDLDVDPSWGKESEHFFGSSKGKKNKRKLFAVAAEDRSVQIFDLHLGDAVSGHKAHVNQTQQREGNTQNKNGSFLHISYMRNGNVLSVDSQDFVVYCVASNSYHRSPLFINTRNQQITAMKCSPFKDHICAFGTSRGLVLVCNMKKCQVLHTLRGHLTPVSSFVWKRLNTSMAKQDGSKLNESNDQMMIDYNRNPDLFDMGYIQSQVCSHYNENDGNLFKFNKTCKFPSTCKILLCDKASSDISNIDLERNRSSSSSPEKKGHPMNIPKRISQHSSSNEGSLAKNGESIEGSIEIINYSSSDDANVMDGDHRKPKVEVLHHIYHQAEVHAAGSANGKAKETIEPIKSTDSESSVELSDSLVDPNLIDNKNSDYETFLLSVSEDSAIWLWNSETGAVCEGMNKLGNGKTLSKQATIAWADDLKILVTDKFYGVTIWIPEIKPEYATPRYNDADKYRSRIINVIHFSLVPGTKKLWCLSRDRKVVLIDAGLEEMCLEVGTVACAVKLIAECPDDMNKIALALMDKRVGIFDISKLTTSVIPVQNFSCNSSVTCLAWSPDCSKLAFGALDGRLGVINIEMGKIMFEFRPKYCREIYSMAWLEDYVLFICNGCVCANDCGMPKADSIVLVKDVGQATSLTVRNEFLIVGIQDGQVVVFRRDRTKENLDYYRLQTLILIPRYITMMAWSPLQKDLLAVVGNDNQVSIIRLYEDREEDMDPLEVEEKLMSPYRSALITGVKWSNCNENLLLTNDRQGNIIVWDLSKKDKIHMKKKFPCPITSAIFLPSDENTIMCSGSILPLTFISIREEITRGHIERVPVNTAWATKTGPEIHTMTASEKKRARKARRRDLKKSADKMHGSFEIVNSDKIKSEQEKEMEEERKKKIAEQRKDKNNAEQAKEKSESNKGCDDEATKMDKEKDKEDMIELMERSVDDSPLKDKKHNYMTHPTTILYLTAKDLNKNTMDKLKIALTGSEKEITDSIICSNLLKDRELAHNLMKAELENHTKQKLETRPLASICLNLMNKDSLRGEIINCIDERTLSEWHVSLAPTYGITFWNYCCKAFALQLIDQGYVLQAATFMIANHREIDAVKALIRHKYYREALLFCRIGFQLNNPLTEEVIHNWLSDLENNGNVQGAALICVILGNYKQGYQYLSKIRQQTPQIVEVLELIKEKGDLYSVLGEKRPEKKRISFSNQPPSFNGSSQSKKDEPPNNSAGPEL